MAYLDVPSFLDEKPVIEFLQKIRNTKFSTNSLQLNFSEVKFSRPFGMLLFATEVRRFAKKMNIGIEPVGLENESCSYLAHMGFFKAIGHNFGNQLGYTPKSANYLPITPISPESLIQNEKPLAERVQTKAIS